MPHPPISLTSEHALLVGKYVARRMITSTTRRRLLHSSTTAAKRTIRSSFVGTKTLPFGFFQPTNRIQLPLPSLLLPSRTTFFSTDSTPGNKVHDGDTRKQLKTRQGQNKNNTRDDQPTTVVPTRFEDLNLHPLTLRALRRQGIHNQTEIQEKTHDVILRGHNVLARSRTGTGKTLAFLVPTIERFLLAQQQNQQQQSVEETTAATIAQQQQGIPILVLAPTRELAAQIGTEAEKLLLMHNKQQGTSKLSSQVVYGGSSKKEDIRKFQKQLPTILVATPGRLKDHL